MKNIYLIPTDKPGRLCFVVGIEESTLTLFEDEMDKGKRFFPQNIYITSDEEIKEGDWCLDKFNQRWKLEDKKLISFDSKGIKRFSTDNILGHECKKIILTTDQSLDGVQAIDDEFLEWFVKNPSCKRVDASVMKTRPRGSNDEWKVTYKIIIPEENKIYRECPNGCRGKLSYLTKDECLCSCGTKWNIKTNKLIIPKEEPKQETLEEAAEKWYDSTEENKGFPKIKAFIAGAKWQQEKSYSEEDMKLAFTKGHDSARLQGSYKSNGTFEEDWILWFEQFKKK